MSRRHSAEKREINPDPKFGNMVVSKFMNSIMHAGKKSVAENIVYGALDRIEGKTRARAQGVRAGARQRHAPTVEVNRDASAARPPKCGGSARVAARGARDALVIEAARERNEKTMAVRLSDELMDT